MKVGISTASLFLKENTEDALALFDRWKVPVAEVFLTSFCEYEPSFAALLASRKGGVDIHSVHVLNTQYEPQLYADHPRVRSDAYALLEKTLSSARLLGARYYTFHGVARIKRTFRENLPRSAEKTREIAAFCARRGVTLSFENVEWALFNRPEVFAALGKETPSLAGTLDIKQARLSGYDYRAYLAAMGERISHVHVADFNGDGTCLPGRGSFDFAELFSRLKDVGFRGPVLIENYARDFADEEELRRAFLWLSELADRI